jgi:hypothetical protein
MGRAVWLRWAAVGCGGLRWAAVDGFCFVESFEMPSSQSASEVFDQVYLDIRAGLLVLGASLDRVDRGEGSELIEGDLRREKIQSGLEILSSPGQNRAEQIQVLFSDPYQSGWNADD